MLGLISVISVTVGAIKGLSCHPIYERMFYLLVDIITGLDTNWLDFCPPNLSLARLATDMRCLLWQLFKFKIVQIEAIAQGATVCSFLLAPT